MDISTLSDAEIEAFRVTSDLEDLEAAERIAASGLSLLQDGEEPEVPIKDEPSVLALSAEDQDEIIRLAKIGKLNRSPKSNWVEESGGLPAYIEDIAHSLHTKRGMTISRAIATAVSMVKRWARGGENVNADTRAKAAKAVAQWQALKAKNKARQAAKKG